MKYPAGCVFSLAEKNAPIPGCTVSEAICRGETGAVCFSLAEDTDISAEIYFSPKLLVNAGGILEVSLPGGEIQTLHTLDAIVTPADVPVGTRTAVSAVYLEINIGRNQSMNQAIKTGEIFRLSELVPYQDGKIVNMDVASSKTMKFALMAFDAGTGLSEHAAPGDALIFALDGEGVIGYEGEKHVIRAGENFRFARGGKHYVRADKRFKMALFLTLE